MQGASVEAASEPPVASARDGVTRAAAAEEPAAPSASGSLLALGPGAASAASGTRLVAEGDVARLGGALAAMDTKPRRSAMVTATAHCY